MKGLQYEQQLNTGCMFSCHILKTDSCWTPTAGSSTSLRLPNSFPHIRNYSLKSSPASKGHPKFDRSQHQLGGLITGCIWPMGYTGHAHRALFHLIWQGYGCCWALYSFLSFFLFFFPPRKQRCKISHRTIWQLYGGFPFAFKWDYTCYTMELSQNLTQQLDSVFSLGSAPVSNVIGSDLQFLGDLQLSFTKIISSV